jgi:DNA-binding XRE family transcriptional regulator/mannose-6-phosphate isomerase-like protein (cupin superfamily)
MSDRSTEAAQDEPTMAGGLRSAREGLGMSQRELAARVNVSPSMISQIEAGQSQPSVNTLYAIVTELDISMDELFGHRPGSVPDDSSAPDDSPAGSGSPASDAFARHAVRSATASRVTDAPGPDGQAGRIPEPTSPVGRGPGPTMAGLPEVQGAIGRAPVVIRGDERSGLRLDTGVTWERLASPDTEAVDFMEVVYDVGGTSSRDGTFMRHNSVEVAVVLSGALDVQVGFDVHHLVPGDSIAFDSTVPHRLWNPGEVPARAVWLVLAQ